MESGLRERRRYRAEMPATAWRNGKAPREHKTRRAAMGDLAEGLERYLRGLSDQPAHRWAKWAMLLASGRITTYAPDGSEWRVVCQITYGGGW